ncbi:MAG TPA: acetyl-CoA decarbonylase/synthase complex subunit gamma [Planctomycetota bacterium]|nr:acetyl-CoA decarbonylase/synthase complex subunit gamma [Planctomycetota bacterium]
MALTAMDIFKLLPRTNCRKCGQPTCLAFAMLMAQKKAKLEDCPDVSQDAKDKLGAAAAPPIQLVAIGTGTKELKIGNETQLFRHDEKFHHPCGIAVLVPDTLDDAALAAKIEKTNKLQWERVGQHIKIDLVALENASGDAAAFAKAAKTLADKSEYALVLITNSAAAMRVAAAPIAAQKPLLCGADAGNADAMAAVAKELKCPLVVKGDGLEATADLVEKVKKAGVEQIVIDPGARDLKGALQALTLSRRAALKRQFRPFGHPAIAFATAADPLDELLAATTYVMKYAGIVVVQGDEPPEILPILTARQNIYTDPQKPIQVDPKLYPIGEPGENAPVMFTTNFSLTFYTVQADIEASRVASYLLAVNTEGLSVLTAYSGDKLTEKTIKDAIDKAGLADKVKHRKLIIPGYVAVLSGKIEEATGWQVLVGPKESSFIPKFLQQVWS